MDEEGSYEENIQAINDLQKVFKKLGVVNDLMEIKKAGTICMNSDPSKAPKFFRAIEHIMNAAVTNDRENAVKLLNEIMPDVYDVVDQYESKTTIIHKDITK